jgi:hypothetical protein
MKQVLKPRPKWSLVAGAAGCLAIGAMLASLAFVLMAAQTSPPGKYDKDIEKAIRAAIMTDIQIVEIPPGNSPGHMSDQAVQQMKGRLAQDLGKVYGGNLLTDKLQSLNNYIDVAEVNANIAVNTDGGISELTLDPAIVQGNHATVHGIYAVWVTGQHKENGQLKNDRVESRYTFTAGLDLTAGAWLVTSWSDIQIDGASGPTGPIPTNAATSSAADAPTVTPSLPPQPSGKETPGS